MKYSLIIILIFSSLLVIHLTYRGIIYFFTDTTSSIGSNATSTISNITSENLKNDIALTQNIKDFNSLIELAQNIYFQNNARYFQGKKTNGNWSIAPADKEAWNKLIFNLPIIILFEEVEIIEYTTSKNQGGYQIIFYKNGFNKSIGYGFEASQRTWDWH